MFKFLVPKYSCAEVECTFHKPADVSFQIHNILAQKQKTSKLFFSFNKIGLPRMFPLDTYNANSKDWPHKLAENWKILRSIPEKKQEPVQNFGRKIFLRRGRMHFSQTSRCFFPHAQSFKVLAQNQTKKQKAVQIFGLKKFVRRGRM